MPELPEVETIKRGLAKFIVGQKIQSLDIFCEKSFQGPDGPENNFSACRELTENQVIKSIDRRGKALLVNLENNITMMIHLRMTGQLIFRTKDFSDTHTKNNPAVFDDAKIASNDSFAGGHPSDNFIDALPNRQTRVVFNFSDGSHLYFNDQRKFGFVKLLHTSEIEDDPFIKKLAKEPWDITCADFTKNCLRHKNSSIKATILDQTVIAGVGNIYADEALFASNIHPARLSGSLTETEFKNLLKNITKVMDASINSGGSTMATYVRADGTKGNYLEKFAQVFRRDGEPCPRCGTELIKIRIAGRGTHICPHCQPISKSEPTKTKTKSTIKPIKSAQTKLSKTTGEIHK